MPPQGRADYAFFQHILKSLKAETGRCAVLFPHGVLFRNEESAMRQKLIESDVIECVLGLGANLFYNSPMEACVIVCRMNKPIARRGKVLFINAVNEVTRERAQSFLTLANQAKILQAYENFADQENFSRVVSIDEINSNNGNLNIPLYIRPAKANSAENSVEKVQSLDQVINQWLESSHNLRNSMNKLFATLDKNSV